MCNINWWCFFVRTYTDCKEDLQYELKSADGTLNETLHIPKMLVEDIEHTVASMKAQYDSDAAGGVFNGFINLALMNTMDYFNTDNNLELFLKRIGGSNGNKNIKKD